MSNDSQPRVTHKPTDTQIEQAIAAELKLRDEAADLRKGHRDLTPELYNEHLWPLLCEPIPPGFIAGTSAGKGKPYASTGVKSLQVLVDRMNNVLSPLWWWYEVDYSIAEGQDHGKLAEVTVYVGTPDNVLTRATSRGGVGHASTLGNLFKGTETNAAKRAFAQIGPGHEVYLGAVDLDPDVNEEIAADQANAPDPMMAGLRPIDTIPGERVADLLDALKKVMPEDSEEFTRELKLKLGSMGVSAGKTIGTTFAKMTPAQGAEIDAWLSAQADAQAETEQAPEATEGGES